ncbi:MAG: hypothetical protein ABI605_12465 [Rhizobacter sp.]
MNGMAKYFPWLLSAVLAIFLLVNWVQSNGAMARKEAEIQSLRQQYKQLVDEANKKIEAASQREIQVRVAFRKALFGSGNVASLTNQSGQAIAVTADIERPASSQSRSLSMTIDPGQSKEIGEREGWAFIAGDKMKVSQPGHKALVFAAP